MRRLTVADLKKELESMPDDEEIEYGKMSISMDNLVPTIVIRHKVRSHLFHLLAVVRPKE